MNFVHSDWSRRFRRYSRPSFAIVLFMPLAMVVLACTPETSVPTATPPPSATLQSTPPPATPSAIAASVTACPTEHQTAYLLALAEIHEEVEPALGWILNDLTEAVEQPALVSDSNWDLGLIIHMGMMKLAAAEIRGLDPPVGSRELHAIELGLADDLELVANEAGRDVDAIDAGYVAEVEEGLTRINKLMTDSANRIERFCE